MKIRTSLIFSFIALSMLACEKSGQGSQVSLTASTTEAVVGETVAVNLSTNANASQWTATPSAAVTKAYSITKSKVNYFTFNKAGTYTIAVRAKTIAYDSTSNQSIESCWNRSGGNCTKGVDSASVSIKVTQ